MRPLSSNGEWAPFGGSPQQLDEKLFGRSKSITRLLATVRHVCSLHDSHAFIVPGSP